MGLGKHSGGCERERNEGETAPWGGEEPSVGWALPAAPGAPAGEAAL